MSTMRRRKLMREKTGAGLGGLRPEQVEQASIHSPKAAQRAIARQKRKQVLAALRSNAVPSSEARQMLKQRGPMRKDEHEYVSSRMSALRRAMEEERERAEKERREPMKRKRIARNLGLIG